MQTFPILRKLSKNLTLAMIHTFLWIVSIFYPLEQLDSTENEVGLCFIYLTHDRASRLKLFAE